MKEIIKEMIISNSNIDNNDILNFKQGIKDDLIQQTAVIIDEVLKELSDDILKGEPR